MLKKITIAIISFLSSSIFVLSVLVLVLSSYMLQPQNIFVQLEAADAYNRISMFMSEVLVETGGEYGELIDDNLEFEGLVTSTINNNVTNFLSWFGGESSEWYVYLPLDLLEAQLGEGQLQQLISDSITDQIVNKRTCTAEEAKAFDSLLQFDSVADLEQAGDLNLPDCFPADPAYREQAQKIAADIVATQNESEPLFDQLRQEFGLEGVGSTMTALDFQEFVTEQARQSAPSSATSSGEPAFDLEPIYHAQQYFTIARYAAIIGLGASLLIILLLAAWKGNLALSWTKMMTSLGITLVIDGILLLILLRLSLNQGVEKALEQANLPLTSGQQAIVAEVQTAAINYLDKPYLIILGIGLVMVVLFASVRIILARRNKSVDKPNAKST